MSNSVNPDEPFHLDLSCLQKPFIVAYGSEKVKNFIRVVQSLGQGEYMYLGQIWMFMGNTVILDTTGQCS